MDNRVIAQELLKDNYLGLEAWEKLGLSASEIQSITLPPLSDTMLEEIRQVEEKGQNHVYS